MPLTQIPRAKQKFEKGDKINAYFIDLLLALEPFDLDRAT